jgi:hypothetical protein
MQKHVSSAEDVGLPDPRRNAKAQAQQTSRNAEIIAFPQARASWIFSADRRAPTRPARLSANYPIYHWPGPDGSTPRYPDHWPRPYASDRECCDWIAGFAPCERRACDIQIDDSNFWRSAHR